MAVEITTLSSKGQVVIPKSLRERLGLKEGERLLVFARGDLLVIRRTLPNESLLSVLADSTRRKIARLGINRKDVKEAVRRARSPGGPQKA